MEKAWVDMEKFTNFQVCFTGDAVDCSRMEIKNTLRKEKDGAISIKLRCELNKIGLTYCTNSIDRSRL